MQATIQGCDMVWPSPIRTRAVAVGAPALVRRDEQLARHLGHRGQHPLVVDPAAAQLALAPCARARQWM